MKKVSVAITIATLYALLFQFTFFVGISEQIIFCMFLLSPFVILYLAYIILKYGKPSPYAFEERFYDDFNYRRNTKELLTEDTGTPQNG
jgi:hypothetical protein